MCVYAYNNIFSRIYRETIRRAQFLRVRKLVYSFDLTNPEDCRDCICLSTGVLGVNVFWTLLFDIRPVCGGGVVCISWRIMSVCFFRSVLV